MQLFLKPYYISQEIKKKTLIWKKSFNHEIRQIKLLPLFVPFTTTRILYLFTKVIIIEWVLATHNNRKARD